MGTWLQLAIAILALFAVFRFLRKHVRRNPADAVEDPFAGVPATRKRGPGNRSGAVALAEPDEDDDSRSYPPRIG